VLVNVAFIPHVILWVFLFLKDLRWKITISGEDIQLSGWGRKRDLAFEQVTSVSLTRIWKHLRVYDASGLPFLVFRDCVNYQEFVVRLKEAGIPGTESLLMNEQKSDIK